MRTEGWGRHDGLSEESADLSFTDTVTASLDRSRQPVEPDRALARRTLTDYVACVAGGLRLPFIQQARASLSVGPQQIVCGPGCGVSTQDAAFANAVAAHAQDFDDTHWSSTVHPSAVLWSGLFATTSAGIATRSPLRAYQAGIQFICDVAPFVCPSHIRGGWHSTSTVGSLAAAVALSHLHGQSLDESLRAVALAGTMMGGLRRNNPSGAKAIHAGRAAATAVHAVRFAALPAFEGSLSLAAIQDAFALVGSTGARAGQFSDITFKRYPTCTGTHAAIEAMEQLARNKAPDSIVVVVPAIVWEETHTAWPTSLVSARLGLPYVVAVAATYGRLDEDLLQSGLSDERVERAFQTIRTRVDPPVDGEAYRSAAALEVAWGREVETLIIDCPRGDPRRPMTDEDLDEKMRLQSSHIWSESRQDRILETIFDLALNDAPEDFLRLVELIGS